MPDETDFSTFGRVELVGVADAETAARERVMDLLDRVDASTVIGEEAATED
jgi:hypothetical protein